MSILNKINEILFLADPMRTACVENKLEDEYVEEAIAINYCLNTDSDIEFIKSSVKVVFERFFWEECLYEEEVADIAKDIQLILAKA